MATFIQNHIVYPYRKKNNSLISLPKDVPKHSKLWLCIERRSFFHCITLNVFFNIYLLVQGNSLIRHIWELMLVMHNKLEAAQSLNGRSRLTAFC